MITTVERLIKKLQEFPKDMEVRICEPKKMTWLAQDEYTSGFYKIKDISTEEFTHFVTGEKKDFLFLDFESGEFDETGNLEIGCDYLHSVIQFSKR